MKTWSLVAAKGRAVKPSPFDTTTIAEILFTRAVSFAEAIERQLQATTKSIDAALYRLDSLRSLKLSRTLSFAG